MTVGLAVIQARDAGEIRYLVVTESSGDLGRVLTKLGLNGSARDLAECTREPSLSILTQLLWKDMAYGSECLAEVDAREMAGQIITQHECPTSKYFSNAARHENGSLAWMLFTESTFDAGLINRRLDAVFFCIRFQDED